MVCLLGVDRSSISILQQIIYHLSMAAPNGFMQGASPICAPASTSCCTRLLLPWPTASSSGLFRHLFGCQGLEDEINNLHLYSYLHALVFPIHSVWCASW